MGGSFIYAAEAFAANTLVRNETQGREEADVVTD
jgi:hypothetical protein